MSNSIVDMIAAYLGLPPYEVVKLSLNAHKIYRRYYIPKKKGGEREIFHPSKQTKSLQYAIIETILAKLPIHQASAAYIRGVKSPLLVNAKKHSNFAFSVRVDFENFFPSIAPEDLLKILKDSNAFSKISGDDSKFISRSLFIRYSSGLHGLAIGAPSSPIVSNAVMFSLDENISKLAMSISAESIYTRYADDVFFSTNKQGACKEFVGKLKLLLHSTESPDLRINKSKTRFTSRGSKRVVTGLYICPDGGVSIGRKNKRYIRKLLYDLKMNRLGDKEKSYLQGYLSFILDVEPDFFNRLALKYGGELVNIAHKGTPSK